MAFFLASTIDNSIEGTDRIFIGCDESAEPRIILLKDIAITEKEVIAFNFPTIVNYLRTNKLGLPKSVVDIFQMFKLLRGKPSKYHLLSEPRLVWTVFKEFIEDKTELASVLEVISMSSHSTLTADAQKKLLLFVSYLQKIFLVLSDQLDTYDERIRFENIEKPFNHILLKRQYEGINVSHKMLNEKIERVTIELNALNKRMRYEYNIFNPQNTAEVKVALKGCEFIYLSKMVNRIDSRSFWNFIKTGSEQDSFLKMLYAAYRLSFDRNSLLRIVVEEDEKVYPIFDCCGTVTARTQVRTPLIQQLKRTSRDFLTAKEGYVLLYADYSQFEPGILANLADDDNLINCYNNEDLYSSLSVELFGNEEARSFCKIIFLSFMYGMSNMGLESLVHDFFHKNAATKSEELKKFFEKFTNLIPYKTSLQEIILKENRIGSSLGNHRYLERSANKHLPNKVKRWVLSQKVQGTASLILKSAVLTCCKDEQVEFLVPMHDAALFQVPIELVSLKKNFIQEQFEKAMLFYCPKLKPKVLFKSFTT